MIRRSAPLAVVLILAACTAASAQTAERPVMIVVGQEPTLPIPTLISATVNQDVADQLFLRLAAPGITISTAGDGGFQPQLAETWRRRDSLTLVFDLHPKARWHDGRPVTAQDVLFAFGRARDPKLAPQLATLLSTVADVSAESERRVVIRFRTAYPEQMYDAVFHVAPLPAHLLQDVPPDQLAQSAFAQKPVGNGPFRFVRRVAGEFTELAAVPDFFLGKVGPSGVIFRVSTDPEARLNLVLSGEADGYEATVPPSANRARVEASGKARTVPTPTLTVVYLNFNQRAADKRTPHPILGDVRVRQALVHALDRPVYAKALYAGYADVPVGPASQMLWVREPRAVPSAPFDTTKARLLLAAAGWRDSDGDGIVDRNGEPLALRVIAPSSSYARRQIVQIAEQQWKAIGVQARIELVEPSVFGQRRREGAFDVTADAATQDPSPSGLTQTWSCNGGSNITGFCNRQVDSLMQVARFAKGTSPARWRQVLRRIDDDAPAAFLAAPSNVVALSNRVRQPVLVPWSLWSSVWRWGLAPTR
jgi:peptide/nickel transport system substrate-binding protein